MRSFFYFVSCSLELRYRIQVGRGYSEGAEPCLAQFRSLHTALTCHVVRATPGWVQVGNSGMFRPEMLRPMGLPEDVNVIAWGLSLERPTMILYGIDNIRDLFGHRVCVGGAHRTCTCKAKLDLRVTCEYSN